MKVQYMSDVHLEFGSMKMPEVTGDVLVLAGDIHVGTGAVEWINEAAAHWKDIIYILGNHEFYHNDVFKLIEALKQPGVFEPNVHFLNNETITIEGVKFAATTLWANMERFAFYSMNDSNYIKYGVGKMVLDDVHAMFKKNMNFLLDNVDDTDVIITHHCPSIKSINTTRYPDDTMNSGYYTDILDNFEVGNVKHWICGHTHSATSYNAYGIEVHNNCRGYKGYGMGPEGCEVADFNPEAYFEV